MQMMSVVMVPVSSSFQLVLGSRHVLFLDKHRQGLDTTQVKLGVWEAVTFTHVQNAAHAACLLYLSIDHVLVQFFSIFASPPFAGGLRVQML